MKFVAYLPLIITKNIKTWCLTVFLFLLIKAVVKTKKESEEKAYKEKREIVKNLLGVLDVETIAKKFNITVEELK